MPGRHAAPPFRTIRTVLSFAALMLVMVAVWFGVRAFGPSSETGRPVVAQSSPPRSQASIAFPPVSPSAVSATRSASVSASRKRVQLSSPSASPSPSSSTTFSSRTTRPSPTAAGRIEAVVTIGANWEQGYVGSVQLRNTGGAPAEWRLTVRNRDVADLQLLSVWNAMGEQRGTTLIFQGGRLAPGASASFGFQAAKSGRGSDRPSGCSVVVGICRMR